MSGGSDPAERAALERLEAVYGAGGDPESLARGYAAWAAHYDRDTALLGYQVPAMVAAMTARHVPAGDGPGAGAVLDVGAGTGLIGLLLQALGYGPLDAVDMSADMLAVARGRGVYRQVLEGVLGERLPVETGAYAAVTAGGVFTAGHAPDTGFAELARALAPGGRLVVALRADGDHAAAYLRALEALAAEGAWTLEAESRPYRTFTLSPAEAHVRNRVQVWRRPA